MDREQLKDILDSVKRGNLSVRKALSLLKDLPYEDIGTAKVDHHRALRHGVPEVVYAKGKNIKDIISIADALMSKSGRLFITKASREIYKKVVPVCRRYGKKATYHEKSCAIVSGGPAKKTGLVAVICAGTSDIPVAEEASVTASFLGSKTSVVFDVGVAGLHRLMSAREVMSDARVIIVVAGMEGALPSVIGGMTDRPVIAVPTSVGYGTNLGGLTPLFAMLNSCVPGIAVANIDNGFGAGVLAHKINTITVKG